MNNLPDEINRRILVIDDNRAIHDDFRKILSPDITTAAALDATETAVFGSSADKFRQTEFEVDSAYQGQEGVMLAAKAIEAGRPYAMAFVDVRMPPGWDGVETTRKLWEIDPDLQIVLCTAYSDYSWGEMFEELGQRDGLLILKKPFDSVEALQMAHALTEKWRLHRQSRQKMEELEGRVAARTAELATSNEALQRQHTELRVLFDLVPAMICFKDTKNGILRANQRMAELAGKSVAEIEGRPSLEIYPHQAAKFHADDLEVIRTGIPKLGIVESVPDHEGKTVWLQTDKVPYRDQEGKVIGVVVMAQDITERRRAEAALQESELRYHSLFENMLEGYAFCQTVFEQDQLRDFLYLEVNGAFEKLTGLRAVIGKKVSEVIPGFQETNRELFELYRRVALTGQSERCETQVESLGIWLSITVYSRERKHFVAVFDNITERKRAEAALRASEAEFRALAEAMPQMVWITRPDSWNIYFSRQWMDYTGLTLEESLGHGWNKPFHPEDQERAWDAWRHATATAGTYSIECRLRRADGAYRWWLIRGVPQQDGGGNILKWFGTCTDIHDLKLAELEVFQANQALRESNEKFHQLADNITDAFWIRSPDMHEVQYVSPAFERIWGRSVASLYAHPEQWADFILQADRERVLAAFAALTGDAPNLDIDYRIVRPDGGLRTVRVRGFQVRDAAGQLIRHIGIVSDITERTEIEERLRLLGSAVQQSKESIIITDATIDLPGPKIIFVNPAFTQMTGYPAEEVMGKTPRILQGPRTDKAVLARLRQNLERGEPFEGEAVNYRKDGGEFNLEWQIAPLRNLAGEITHFVAIQHDITERKRLEVQLFQSQKLETVGKLAGGFAHEFNSILTAIIGQSELLLGELPAGSQPAGNAVEISKAAGRAAKLTRQLLAYGRKQFLQPEILDLNRVIAGMEGVLQHLVGGGVDTRFVSAPDLRMVKADAGQIEQVIMNLLMNARDAMPNGGKLTLETANVSFDQESIGRYPELPPGGYVMLAVTDTGMGMSEETKARIFEPFFTTKGVGQGTGLGLSTCYGIIKQSGGHISAYSEPGRGATFKVYLPQDGSAAAIPVPQPAPADLPRGTETILLVEDDPALRDMAAALLRRLGYRILPAANGLEALSLKQQRDIGHIDLLFTDVVMPHMSGTELADRVRALYPHTRILFTSAYTENAIVHQGVLEKGVALLQKPFTPSALARKIRQVLDLPGEIPPDARQKSFGFTDIVYKVKTS